MPRGARIVAPDVPHHVTQRGNRRAPIFFEDGDHDIYRNILAAQCRRHGVAVWAYCLMPNHVHLVLTPTDTEGLAKAVGGAHRRYTAFINARQGWIGHLFQARFASTPMDEAHLRAAIRYVSLNPVRARLTQRPQDWPWSSVRAHLAGMDDRLVTVAPVLERTESFAQLIAAEDDDEGFTALRAAEVSGRPLGGAGFLAALETSLGRPMPKPRAPNGNLNGDSLNCPLLL